MLRQAGTKVKCFLQNSLEQLGVKTLRFPVSPWAFLIWSRREQRLLPHQEPTLVWTRSWANYLKSKDSANMPVHHCPTGHCPTGHQSSIGVSCHYRPLSTLWFLGRRFHPCEHPTHGELVAPRLPAPQPPRGHTHFLSGCRVRARLTFFWPRY